MRRKGMAGFFDSKLKRLILLLLAVLCASFTGRASAENLKWERTVTSHFVVFYEAGSDRKAADFEKEAEAAYAAITRQFDLHPVSRIPLYLYDQHRDFRKAAGILPHDMVVGTSNERGGLIKLDASNLFADAEMTLRHEIVHSVLALSLKSNIENLPLWMNEGLAQVTDQPEKPDLEELTRTARGEARLRKLSDLSVEFPHGDDSDVAYAEAYSATAYFVHLYRWGAMRDLLHRLETGEGFSESFRKATGNEIADFYTGWESTLVRRGWLAWLQMFYAPLTGLALIGSSWVAYRRVMERHREIEREDLRPEADDASEALS
jgi:hypothetical protein